MLTVVMVSAALIYMNYGIMWSISEEVKIPRHLYGTAVGVASIIGYLPDSFMHTIFGNWLDQYGADGYRYIFMFLIGLCVISVITCVIAMQFKRKNA